MPGVVATELREALLALGLIDAAVCVGSDGKAVAKKLCAAASVHQGLLLAGARGASESWVAAMEAMRLGANGYGLVFQFAAIANVADS